MGTIMDLATATNDATESGDYFVVDNATLGTRKVPCGRMAGSTVGYRSHAEGNNTTASNACSHAEGASTTASGLNAHAEGTGTIASGDYSHAEGHITKANANRSHAEGYNTTASGLNAHAEGASTTASGLNAHAEGTGTIASGDASHTSGYYTTTHAFASMAIGKYNNDPSVVGSANSLNGMAFSIGNGSTSSTATFSNAFSVMYNGIVKAAGTITASTTADYAEFFEFADGNPNDEDRVAHFVTFDTKNKIRFAQPDDIYVLGVISGAPFVLGNGDCDVWNGMYLRDEFGRYLTEPAEKIELVEDVDDEGNVTGSHEEIVTDDEGNIVYEGEKFVVNPNYDPEQPYVSRMDRPEWAAVGMLGVLPVIDDGRCKVDEYCTVGPDGIAVPDEDRPTRKRYRVIERVTDNVIKIVFR